MEARKERWRSACSLARPVNAGLNSGKVDAMSAASALADGIPKPSRVETAAILETINYLKRAGTTAATLALLAADPRQDQPLLETLRDEFLSCTHFCESLLDQNQPIPPGDHPREDRPLPARLA